MLRVGIRAIHTTAKPLAAIPKTGFNGLKTRKKGQKGANDDFYDYINRKKFRLNSQKVFEVPVLSEEIVSGLDLANNKIFKYEGEIERKLNHLGAFKKYQYSSLFLDRVSLIRDEVLELMKQLKSGLANGSSTNKYVILGDQGMGKTTTLAQLQAYVLGNESIVLSIPHPEPLIDGSYEFFYNKKTKLYEQPTYLKRFLARTLKANENLLNQIPLQGKVEGLKEKATIADLLKFKSPKISNGSIYNRLIEELSTQDKFPVFFTVDNFNVITSNHKTVYRDTDNQEIPFDKFQLGKTLFDLTSDKLQFPKGGLILATTGHYKINDTLKVPLGLQKFDVFHDEADYSEALALTLKNIKVVDLKKMPRKDIEQLVEWYLTNDLIINKDKEILQGELNKDKLINEKYILSGGNPTQLIKACNLFF